MTKQLKINFESRSHEGENLSFIEYMEWLDNLYLTDKKAFWEEFDEEDNTKTTR